jgi:PAS domain S-box-containing protein
MFTLLYIDDEPGLLEIGRIYLENTGDFSVTTALSGKAGLDALGQHDFDAIVADYQMPEMDGIELLKNVRQSFGNIPFILFTGRGREEVVIEAINNGVDFYLQKGGDPTAQFAELAHKIRQAMSRRQAEIGLSDSEKRFRELADLLPQGIYEADTEGRMLYVNRIALQLSGYTAEDIEKGLNALNVIVPEDQQRAATLFRQMVETGSRSQGSAEYLGLRKDGSTFPVSIFSSPIVKGGRIVGIRGVIIDITEQKKAADELQAANEQLVATGEELRGQYDELAQSEARIRLSEARLTYMLGFYEYAQRSERELLEYAIEGAGIVTGSSLGYLAFLNEDESELAMYAWSKAAMAECSMREKPIIYRTEKTGLWGEAVRQRRPVITNDYAAPNPAKKGYPEGHPHIIRHMNVPVLDEGRIVLVAGVANKQSDYTENDVNELLLLMQGLWTIIKRKRLQEEQKAAYEQLAAAGEELKAQYDELARSELRNRESEEKFRALVESTSDFIWEVDAAGTYTYASPQVRRILGYEPEELLGKTPFEIMPPGEAKRVADEFRRCVDAQLPIVALENEAVRKDGSVVILETSGVIRTAEDGSYLGYRGIDRDITKRKQAEEALKESEARISSILHGSPVLQFVIDRNHRVISWNKALEEYSGIRAADMIGTDQQWRAFYTNKRPVLADLLIDGNTDAITRLYAGKLRKSRYVEEAYEATDFFPHMGSSGIWLSFTAAPIRDVQGAIIGAVETLEDVTERINAENALRESDKWTRTILNTAQAGIVLVDANTHRIVDANRKALELIGLDQDSVIGAVCHRFICPAEEGKCPVTDLGQEVNTSERVLLTSSGKKIPVLKTVVRLSMGGREILVESFVDISEQKRSEDAIREANRKLNLLNSITRHDIRNQLMVAQGYTKLATFSKPEPVVADFLNKITAAVQTIQRQIEFTKEYQELGVHAPAWFMIRNVISTVMPDKMAVRNTCNAVEIFADPMIDKVFYNLFDNAVKYGERVTTIAIGCEETDRGLVITFADNGVGIPVGEKQKIFEKGYGRNTGFGLFLVREILAITGIIIEETGTEGKGAVFEITVPRGAYRKPE